MGEETEEERLERPMTRSEAIQWYRSGGEALVDQEKEIANLAGTWQQFYFMTRGRGEERDADQVPTRSERLHWYRSGGWEMVDTRDQMARGSSKWSQFSNKEEMSDYLSQKRTESMEEREAVRQMVRKRIMMDTMTKVAYETSKNPWESEEAEEESKKKLEASMSREERISKLRQITEEMLTRKSDYSQSAKALAMQAYKEAEEEAKFSSQKRKVTTVMEQKSS